MLAAFTSLVVSPPLSIKAAAYNGMLNPTTESLSTPCKTGNCSWPITPSLAICGGCVNTTYKLKCSSDSSPGVVGRCTYQMPSGKSIHLQKTGDKTPTEISTDFSVIPSSGFHYNANDTDKFYLANFEAVGAPANMNLTTLKQDSVVSSECALWICVQSFESLQRNSNQTSTNREGFSKIQPDSRQNSICQMGDSSYNMIFEPLPPSMNPPAGINFTFNSIAACGFTYYFPSLFNGSVNRLRDIPGPSSDAIQALWNASADLDHWIKNVAASVTNVIRTTEPAHSPQFDGTGFQLGYDVRWAWLSLPALLVGASLVILVTIMIKTWSTPVHAWKGSPLALLFLNVDDDLRVGAFRQMGRHGGLEKGVGKKHAVLLRSPEGEWCFKRKSG